MGVILVSIKYLFSIIIIYLFSIIIYLVLLNNTSKYYLFSKYY